MNRKIGIPLFNLVIFAVAAISCGSSGTTQVAGQAVSERTIAPERTTVPEQTTVPERTATPPTPPPPPPNPYFSGEGGKGMSLAILAPRANGLSEKQGYIPALVQGEFVSNFSEYSALSVMTRETMDSVYAEIFSGYYDDNSKAGLDFGHLTPPDYLMDGSIIRTERGYSLQIRITETSKKSIKASYSGTWAFAELDDLTGVRRASLELLEKIGVRPTERTRTALAGAAATNHVNAQTTLAQGITAQKRGSEAAALTYYYQAATYDPSLLEAAARVSVLAANISSGSIGEDARNDVRWRREWIARLDEGNKFFADYIANSSPPCEIAYSTSMEHGKVNYSTETMPFTFPVKLFVNSAYFTSLEKAVQVLADGLEATGRNREWGLRWPGEFANRTYTTSYKVDFDLVNDKGKVIGTQQVNLYANWSIGRSSNGKISISAY